MLEEVAAEAARGVVPMTAAAAAAAAAFKVEELEAAEERCKS